MQVRHISARKRVDQTPLTAALIHKQMTSLFPKKNDFGDASFEELVPELARFEINTVARFRAMMKKHRRQLLIDDCTTDLSGSEIRFFSGWIGKQEVKDKLRRQLWFAYPALVRGAADLEFGEAAAIYDHDNDDE